LIPLELSILAKGADELNVSVTLLRKMLRWFAKLPPGVREIILREPASVHTSAA
jgi:hypothetical protein